MPTGTMKLSLWLLSAFAPAILAVPEGKRQVDELRECVSDVLGPNASLRIVVPKDEDYDDARVGESIQFKEFPKMIVYADEAREIVPLISCAKAAGIKAVPRTGGHHFLAYSALGDTMVIDITHIDDVNVASDGKTATVGAGIRFGPLYAALSDHNRTWTGGICPTVGISGFLSAGGFNMQMRKNGLGVDNVVAAKVVKADGCIVTASETENPDLWFAIRGGGGGSYGIVVEWTLKLYDYPRSAMAFIVWPEQVNRAQIAKTWHKWAPRTDTRFTSQVNVWHNRTEIQGWCLGCSKDELQKLIDESGVLKIGNATAFIAGGCNTNNARMFGFVLTECLPDEVVAQYAPFVFNHVQQAYAPIPGGKYPRFEWNETPKWPNAPLAAPWNRFHRLAKSFFIQKNSLITDAQIDNIVGRLDLLPKSANAWIEWHAWNLTTPGNAAFAWRDQAYSHMEFIATGTGDEAVDSTYRAWFQDVENYLRPALGVASYAGYADAFMSPAPIESYYGKNINRLKQIKRKYDPDNFFTNPQGIPLR